MLSPKLSKILAEKNVPHEDERCWVTFINHACTCSKPGCDCVRGKYHSETFTELYDTDTEDFEEMEERNYIEILSKVPAYPEIALFKYAKVVWSEEKIKTYYCSGCNTGEVQRRHQSCQCGYKSLYRIHTHSLADLFSSGASLETIEEYVLSSIEEK